VYKKQVRERQSTLAIFTSSWYPGIDITCMFRSTSLEGFICYVIKFLVFFYHAAFLLSSQSYDARFLKIYPELSSTPLQLEEDLEQLKVLENGYKMKVSYDHVLYLIDLFYIYSINFLSSVSV
jgi:hypothetical protein